MTEDGGPPTTLQDLVLLRLAEMGDRTGPMKARQAYDTAGPGIEALISYETVRKIARGEHRGRVGNRIAEGLSRVLRVPVQRVYDTAGIPSPAGPWQWPDRFSRLNYTQRQVVEDVAAAILEAETRARRMSG